MAGFEVSGIMPFNRDIFDESDFAPSFFTDREVPEEIIVIVENEDCQSTSKEIVPPVEKSPLEIINPFPKEKPIGCQIERDRLLC